MKLFPFFEQANMIAEVWKKTGDCICTFRARRVSAVERKSKTQCYNAEKIFFCASFLSPAQVSSTKFSE
jgi:hypothetical protein